MWFINVNNLFDNYESYRVWQDDEQLCGLIFADVQSNELVHVIFTSPINVDDIFDSVRFIENSLPSYITFAGILSFEDIEYSFEINSMSIFKEELEDFMQMVANKRILDTRDTKSLIEMNMDLDLRIVHDKRDITCVLRPSLQLNLSIKCVEEDFFDEVSKVFMSELESIDKLRFVNVESDIILPTSDDGNDGDCTVLLKHSLVSPSGLNYVDLISLIPLTREEADISSPRLVPIVKIRKGLGDVFLIKTPLSCITRVRSTDSYEIVDRYLRIALKRALHLLEKCICTFSSPEQVVQSTSKFYNIKGNLFMVQYPVDQEEPITRAYRQKLHKIFNLPIGKPSLRGMQAIKFTRSNFILESPHLHIKNYIPKGNIFTVKGTYDYHHYMQDAINDCGWGCAYRSFQTIWSWFVHQGFIEKPVPTHRQIQQSLYECGDKTEKFVGSQQWIGSVELGYCLTNMAGIETRMITTSSGDEVAEKTRQLALHFKNFETPVMIGGGSLAHTILGVDFNESTGHTSFLVLDPHYTGDENIQTVVGKGWCGWKPANFWKKEHFYNLLLPIPPTDVL